jgi:hypothetical protein
MFKDKSDEEQEKATQKYNAVTQAYTTLTDQAQKTNIIPRGIMEKDASPHEEAKTQDVPKPAQPELLSEYVLRVVRAAPVEIQQKLHDQAAAEDLTAKETEKRREILWAIHAAPEGEQVEILEEVKKLDLLPEEAKELADKHTVTLVSDEEATKILQAAAAKDRKKEESRKRQHIKKATVKVEAVRLLDVYPAEVLKLITDKFSRQPPKVMLAAAKKFMDRLVVQTEPEKLQQIIDKIAEGAVWSRR